MEDLAARRARAITQILRWRAATDPFWTLPQAADNYRQGMQAMTDDELRAEWLRYKPKENPNP